MKIEVKKYCRYILFAAIFGSGLFAYCSSSEKSVPSIEAIFSASSDFAWNSDGKFLTITTTDKWELGIAYPAGEPSGWCTAAPSNGTGDANVWIATDPNNSGAARRATITVTIATGKGTVNEKQAALTITQAGQAVPPPPDDPPDLTKKELPKVENVVWYLEYHQGKFALEYAPAKKHSKWVAWELHRGHFGSSGRTDAWQFDARIPAEYRPRQQDFGSNGYDRGHIVPSADRTLSYAMNAETFMYSNMTPQNPNLNQQIWADLESKERAWANGNDTLYICAGGTVLKESDIEDYTSPSGMAVPKYNFKVILRKGAAAGSYDAIGFWFENRSYAPITKVSVEQVKTVRQIEELTGLDFFYNLPREIQDKVENEFNPSAWGL